MEVLTPILCSGLPVQWDTGAIVFIDFRWTWQWRLMWLHLGMLRDNTKSHLRISKSTTIHLLNLPCTCNGCRVSRNPVTTQVKWLKMLGDNDMSLRSCSREVSKLTCNSAKDCMYAQAMPKSIYLPINLFFTMRLMVLLSVWLSLAGLVFARSFYANLNRR